ncbi:hypothetical protein, partial [Paenibacillus xylanexedens]|uniref:hypothetical protein n=1 Tax=Paenibacillus xylanexedens TaxID=528191 RepID=UPI001C8E1C07
EIKNLICAPVDPSQGLSQLSRSFCKQNVYSLVVQFSKIKLILLPSVVLLSNFYILTLPNQLSKLFF